jgi:hypothetical protein
MDMLTLSLPLEYSLENNYWTIHALQMNLNQIEREMKFQMLACNDSPILLSQRQCFVNTNIAYQLILAAFNLAPQSIDSNELS